MHILIQVQSKPSILFRNMIFINHIIDKNYQNFEQIVAIRYLSLVLTVHSRKTY